MKIDANMARRITDSVQREFTQKEKELDLEKVEEMLEDISITIHAVATGGKGYAGYEFGHKRWDEAKEVIRLLIARGFKVDYPDFRNPEQNEYDIIISW